MGDYYKILGVNKKATDKEIKKAYRTLSKKYHPDKAGGDEDKFKEISEAYNTLSDKTKRQKYDTRGQIPNGFGNPFGQQQRRQAKGGNVRVTIKMDLNSLDEGETKKIKYKRNTQCSKCDGTGGTTIICEKCAGTGAFIKTVRTPMGMMQSATTCPYCNGDGERIDVACTECNGSGIELNEDTFTIDIPPGLGDNDTLIVNGHGNYVRGGIFGDLLIRISEINHHDFIRNGDDLRYMLVLTYPELTLGGEFEVPTLTNKIKIQVKELSSPGNLMRVQGRGMGNQNGLKGNLLIELVVKKIDYLDDDTKKILNKLQKNLVSLKK